MREGSGTAATVICLADRRGDFARQPPMRGVVWRVRLIWRAFFLARKIVRDLRPTGAFSDLDRLFAVVRFRLAGGGGERGGPGFALYQRSDDDADRRSYVRADVRGSRRHPEPGPRSPVVMSAYEHGHRVAERRFRTAAIAVAWVHLLDSYGVHPRDAMPEARTL